MEKSVFKAVPNFWKIIFEISWCCAFINHYLDICMTKNNHDFPFLSPKQRNVLSIACILHKMKHKENGYKNANILGTQLRHQILMVWCHELPLNIKKVTDNLKPE